MDTHNFNNDSKLYFNTSFQNYERTSKSTERLQPTANGDWKRPLGKNKNLEQIIDEQFSVQGNFKTGQNKHQLFTGVNMENSFSQTCTKLQIVI